VHTAFDELMARANPAMVIVTTAAGGERSGCLVGFHCQCSIDPPRYAVWLSTANHTYRVGNDATHYAVHFVPEDRRDLAVLFGGETGDEVDKLARCDWTEGPHGVPLLDGCPDRFVGRVVDVRDDDGDHRLLLLEPDDVGAGESRGRLRLEAVADIDAGHDADEA
jgi:flavin reductase (DIM6/NTAB) family NADH-FMN oxidoreductase RutF